MTKERIYIAIDLKSFYASVECVERGLDPLTTNLVVADVSRTDKTICLAVTPSLKAYDISGRARLFEVRQRVEQLNYERRMKSPRYELTGQSCNDNELKAHPDWAISYIAAPPRMAFYMKYSVRIYSIYKRFICQDDIHVYSIDEVFIDATDYLKIYKMSAHDLARMLINEVLKETGITATAGIGPNLFLCKVAMDIVAKHIPADKDGVRIAELDEMSFRHKLWDHKPLTSFWRIGPGIARRLGELGIDTMGKIARLSVQNDAMLYRMFGVNAELLIDHAWGWEPCTMKDIKAYRPATHSLSNGQVLTCAYTCQKARIVVNEMIDSLVSQLWEKQLVTKKLVLSISYDRENLSRPEIRAQYSGPVSLDHYGREVPKHSNGTTRLATFTNSPHLLTEAGLALYDRIVNPILLIRRINVCATNVKPMDEVEKEEKERKKKPIQLDLFTDYEAENARQEAEEAERAKERRMQQTLQNIKKRYGKNAILKGLNFAEGATAKERNMQIGGHKA